MSSKPLASTAGAAGVVALVIGVVAVASTNPAARQPPQSRATAQPSQAVATSEPNPSAQSTIPATAAPGPQPAQSCDVLARVIQPQVPYDTLYDPQTATITVYGHGQQFTVDLTDATCRASSPLIDALARDTLHTWRQTARSECASTRKQIEAAGDAEYVVGHGQQIAVDDLRAHAEEVCAARE